jgi:anti-sigma factor RsiW
MNCEICQEKIDAFVDDELSAADARAFEDHLCACGACSSETWSRQRMKRDTRAAAKFYTPDPAFERAVHRRIAARRAHWNWWPAFAGALAVALIAFAMSIAWQHQSEQDKIVAQLVDQHSSALASSNPVDVVSDDRHNVKPWFAGRVPFSVDIPELAGTQFDLIGGSVSYVQQAPAAHLLFGVRKHRISVFIFRETPQTAALGEHDTPSKRMSFQVETWTEDGLRYFAVSDVNGEDVRQLCALLKKS